MFYMSNRFLRDRADAGVKLAQKLVHYRDMPEEAVVVGLPRGGVVIGYHVAHALHLPLDIIVSRKIGCPGHEEFAVGALAQDGSVDLERDTLNMLRLSEHDLRPTIEKERLEAQRRLKAYRGDRPPLDLSGKVAILVDDGIATGSTAKASLRMLSKSNAKRIVLAVPVMPSDKVPAFSAMVNELVYLQAPKDFHAVGQFYQRFDQTADEEVLDLLKLNNQECQRWWTTCSDQVESKAATH